MWKISEGANHQSSFSLLKNLATGRRKDHSTKVFKMMEDKNKYTPFSKKKADMPRIKIHALSI